jgi:hypothetical protein
VLHRLPHRLLHGDVDQHLRIQTGIKAFMQNDFKKQNSVSETRKARHQPVRLRKMYKLLQ